MEDLSQEIGEFVHNVKNALAKLPVKNEGSKMKIIAELLEFDFKKVRQKGYGHKEITAYLKRENLPVPGYLVKKYMVKQPAQSDQSNGISVDNHLDNKSGNEQANTVSKMDTEMANQQATQETNPGNNLDNETDKTLDNPVTNEPVKPQEDDKPMPLIKKGKFVIMPDTPDGEL